MARIRSLKPEILSNEKVGQLNDSEFRLFIGLIVTADDYGNRGASSKQLDAEVFWGREEPVDVPAMLARMVSLDLVTVYRVRGQSYVHLTGWTDHQKVDHPGKPIFPGPDEADKQPDLFEHAQSRERLANGSRTNRDCLAPVSRLTGTGTGTGIRTRSETSPARDPGPSATEHGPEPRDDAAIDACVDRLQKQAAFTVFDLESLMRAIVAWKRTDIVHWKPGVWSSKSFEAHFRDDSEATRLAMVPDIRQRAERFFRLRNERDLSVERFLELWNTLGGTATRAPVQAAGETDEMTVRIRELRAANRKRAQEAKATSDPTAIAKAPSS
jgi:hypothetical protein